jgi:oligoendopeptidase F
MSARSHVRLALTIATLFSLRAAATPGAAARSMSRTPTFLAATPLRPFRHFHSPAPVCAATRTPAMTAAAPPSSAAITGPAWDLSDEYSALDAPALLGDLAAAKKDMAAMKEAGKVIAERVERARGITLDEANGEGVLAALEEVNRLSWSASTLLRNVATYASCTASVDGGNDAAKRLGAEMGDLFAEFSQASASASLFLQLCPEDVAETYLAMSDETAANRFLVMQSRKVRDFALTLDEENLLSAFAVPGLHAWGDLYTDLSASLMVDVEGKGRMGVAAAAGLLDSPDGAVRRAAWLGIKEAWVPHAETSAAVLNALSKWRLETYSRRKLPDFLATPLHQNRCERASLDAMLDAIDGKGLSVGRRALAVQASTLGKAKLEPWDLAAPAPVSNPEAATTYTFEEGIEVIANAVGAVDSKAGEFVRMMRDKGWIEATRGDAKRPGAYCTGFAKSRNPRVYLSEYNGRAPLLLTLAHELGHVSCAGILTFCRCWSSQH